MTTSLAPSRVVTTLHHHRLALAALTGICAIYFFSYFQRVAIPGTIFDELQSHFHASATAVTALSMLFLYIYGGMQIFAGMLTDRAGVLRVLLAGGALLSLGSLAFPMAQTLPALYTARILVALGASLTYASVVKGVDALFSARYYPVLLGIALSTGYAGGLAGTLPFERAVACWGWRPSLLGVGVMCLIAVLASAPLLFRTPALRAGTSAGCGAREIIAVLRNPHIMPVVLVQSINFSVYFLFQATLGKKLLLDYYHLSSATAATFTFVMMLVTIGWLLASGVLTRAIGNRRKPIVQAAVFCMCIGTVLLCCCLYGHWDYRWVLVSYCLLGTTTLAAPMCNTLTKEHTVPSMTGTAIGLGNASCYLAVAIFTGIAGWVMDRFPTTKSLISAAVHYPREAYLTIAFLCLVLTTVSFCLAKFVHETNGIPITDADRESV